MNTKLASFEVYLIWRYQPQIQENGRIPLCRFYYLFYWLSKSCGWKN